MPSTYVNTFTQGPAEVRLAWVGLVGYVNCLTWDGQQLEQNLSKMSYGVVECDIVMLQNYMLMIL